MSEKKLRDELDAVYASTSWRVTAPIRSLGTMIKAVRTKEWLGLSSVKKVILNAARFALRQRALKFFSQLFLLPFPNAKRRIREAIIRSNENSLARVVPAPSLKLNEELSALPSINTEMLSAIEVTSEKLMPGEEKLTAGARSILRDLRIAMNSRK